MSTTADQIIDKVKQIVPALNHCKVLDISVVSAEIGSLVLKLPYNIKIVGNVETGVIHGGALTTLMDTACGFAAVSALKEPGIAPTLDLRIDYMRPAEAGKAVIAKAEAYRVTRHVIFAKGQAYHEGQKDKPIAHCTATFMRLDPKSVKKDTAKIEV